MGSNFFIKYALWPVAIGLVFVQHSSVNIYQYTDSIIVMLTQLSNNAQCSIILPCRNGTKNDKKEL